ncbi:MAG: class I SAM-dependent methyltransferase [Candidatus Omnitrophica bacterium]|nr:class I SAM-dependent methyltransferase [Candidatus Omnitrophota bacterium]
MNKSVSSDHNVFENAYSGDPSIYKSLKQLVEGLSLGAVLDVGSGQGRLLNWLRKQGHTQLRSCDKHPEYLKVEGLCADYCDLDKEPLPYPDHSFDTVFCVEVVEHLENPRHCCREISRVLKDAGTVFLTTPNILSLRSRLSFLLRGYSSYFMKYPNGKDSPHITMLTRFDLERIFKETGFSIQTIRYQEGAMPKSRVTWQRIAPFLRGELFSDTIIIVAKKQQG